MGCCGCSDEVASKVEPKTPENEDASRDSDEVFVTRRSCTDFFALLLYIALLGGFGFLISVAVKKGDIFRVIYGYDDCANVCGRPVGPSDSLFDCNREDMSNRRYLLVNADATGVKSRTCVANCSSVPGDLVVFLNRCVTKGVTDTVHSVITKLGLDSFYREASRDLSMAWRELVYLLLIALAISLCILIAFRYLVRWIIYIILVGVIVTCIGGTTYLWLAWRQEKKAVDSGQIHEDDSSKQAYFIYAIIATTITVITVLIVLVMRKRIALVVQLFKEAGKAVYFMPALLLQPLYTYILMGLVVVGWIYFMILIESAGDLYKNRKSHFHYRKDSLLIGTRWYNLFVFFVTCEFLLGCQHMVVATAVARWFFTRDKNQLYCPVARGFGYLIRYHLGTVAFGALLIGIVRIIRAAIAFVQKRLSKFDNPVVKGILWCCQCCIWCFEVMLRFLTRNAYIETAIYGCNFCTGGKRAFQALSNNILRVAAINSVGDFVLFLGKLLVVALTVLAGIYLIQKKEGIQHPWLPILLAGLFAFLVSHCFISVYEMVIDTIFICFCEDCAKNDGISRPYYMSRGLMEFVENSKKALRELNHRQAEQET